MNVPPIPVEVNSKIERLGVRSYFFNNLMIIDNQVVYQDEIIKDKKGNAILVDANSFMAISSGFFADKNRGYGLTYILRSNSLTLALTPFEFDYDSFKALNEDYAQDKNNTYYADGAIILKGTNYKIVDKETPYGTLNIIETVSFIKMWTSEYICNDKNVFFRGKIIKDALPASFRRLGHYWSKDEKSVFFQNGISISKISEFDAPTFLEIANITATDRYKPVETFFYKTPSEALLSNIAYKNFFEGNTKFDDYWYAKAKRKSDKINGEKVIDLNDGYFHVGTEIFYRNREFDDNYERILDTDMSNFIKLNHGYATNGQTLFLVRDEYLSYFKAFRVIDYDTRFSLEVLSDAWVLNGDFVIYKAIKKIKIDIESFTILNQVYAYDKNGLICNGVRKKDIDITRNIQLVVGVYLKIDDEFFYLGKSRKKAKIDDSKTLLINDFIIMGSDGNAFSHGKLRRNIGNFEYFKQLPNGNWGDGIVEWKITFDGLIKIN